MLNLCVNLLIIIRYGIGAKSAGLGLGTEYLVESKRKSDQFVNSKSVSKVRSLCFLGAERTKTHLLTHVLRR